MDAHPLCMLLILITLLSLISNPVVRMVSTVGITILMGFASFLSFDPVTAKVFFAADIGNGTIYASDSYSDFGGDMSVYNRVYYGQDIVFDKALGKGVEAGDELFAVSTGRSRTTWGIDGGHYSFCDYDEKRVFTEFWDLKKNVREPAYDYDFYDDPWYKQLDLHYIYPEDDIIGVLGEKKSFIYIYMPSQNDGREDIIRRKYDIIEEGSYSSHGWIMSYIRGRSGK